MKNFVFNQGTDTLQCSSKMGGCLFELSLDGGEPIRRLFDAPKLRRIIESIDATSMFDVGNQVVRVDHADQDRLARFLERFL
jgi:hypothetical protein